MTQTMQAMQATKKNVFPDIIGNNALRNRLGRGLLADPPAISHAYIIEGRPGSGRHLLASRLSAALCCAARLSPAARDLPCGVCASCRKILSGISPDVITLGPGDDRATFGVDAVRSLREDVHIFPNELEHKIYIIERADTMTVQAQNAFLLTLEEPPAYAVFFLLCEDAGALLETIRSRAPVLRMQPLTPDETERAVLASMPSAGAIRLREPERFRGILMASEGSAGRAMSLLSGEGSEQTEAMRRGAERFCRLCADRKRGAELLLSLNEDCGSSREEAVAQLKTIRLALRDLTVLKKTGENPEGSTALRFFTDPDAAAELSDGCSLRRLLTAGDAIDEAIDALGKNMNLRLTLLSAVARLGMLD